MCCYWCGGEREGRWSSPRGPKDGGYSCKEAKEAGYSFAEAKAAGYNKREMSRDNDGCRPWIYEEASYNM